MTEIVEYITAAESSRTELDSKVNELIQQGFQPFGSPYVKEDSFPCQAMRLFTQGMSKERRIETLLKKQSSPVPE